MRKPPVFRKLDIPFCEETFPAAATLSFTCLNGEQIGPARQIAVQGGRGGTWTLVFTPHAPLPQGAQVGVRKLENEYRFAYRHQDDWPDAGNYVTVEDGHGQALPFVCDTCLKSAVWALVTLPRPFSAGETIVVRLGDRRWGGRGCAVRAMCYARARVAAGARALVVFRVNGALMGAETAADRDAQIEWQVEGTAPLERVDLIRDQYRLHTWECETLSERGSVVDRPPDGTHYYYLRIEQQDGELL
jgi:hypothetical protein